MKYPRLPKSLDRRCKLTEKDIKKIREMYRRNFSKEKIAKKFKVSTTTIFYWVNEEHRQNKLEYDREYRKEWRKNNIKECTNETKKYTYSVNQRLRKYMYIKNRNRRRKNKKNKHE